MHVKLLKTVNDKNKSNIALTDNDAIDFGLIHNWDKDLLKITLNYWLMLK